MKDNAFQRRRDIERMLLSGKKLTTSEMMKMYGVGRKAIRRDFDIIGEELNSPLSQSRDMTEDISLRTVWGSTRTRSRRNSWNAWKKWL